MPLPPKAWPEVLVHLSLAQIPVLSMENGGLQSCKGFAEGQSRAGQVLPPKHTHQTLSLNLPRCFNQPELPVGCFSIHRSFPAQPPVFPFPKEALPQSQEGQAGRDHTWCHLPAPSQSTGLECPQGGERDSSPSLDRVFRAGHCTGKVLPHAQLEFPEHQFCLFLLSHCRPGSVLIPA